MVDAVGEKGNVEADWYNVVAAVVVGGRWYSVVAVVVWGCDGGRRSALGCACGGGRRLPVRIGADGGGAYIRNDAPDYMSVIARYRMPQVA